MELTRDQTESLPDKLALMLGYLTKVRQRMVQMWLERDGVFPYVVRAQASPQDLCPRSHYRACRGGVGRPPR
jgi:hypothetical protein